jgi:hypothetical protein
MLSRMIGSTGWVRKLGISVHVVLSVGWLGAVAAFVALAFASLGSDQVLFRAAFVGMGLIGRWVIVPLSLGALASGVVQSISTKWGLTSHYWILIKLLLTIAATAALLLHQLTAVEEAAHLSAQAAANTARDLHGFGIQLLADAVLAVVVLSIITVISIYKPWGLTPFATRAPVVRTPRRQAWSLRLLVAGIIAFVVAFVTLHLSGRSPHHTHGH